MTQDIRETLKLALEALLHAYHEDEAHPRTLEAITAIKEALAQEQEPVAWVVYSSAENDIVWADKGKRLKQNTPLYTTPPQRTWVGLTDEDRQAAFESMPDMLDGFLKTWGWLHFSKAIEAKLKERNT